MIIDARCLFCERDQNAVPLIVLAYRGKSYNICTQHLPVVVHDPAQLVGILPDADRLEPSEHRD